jgi:hypothetical protein
MSGPYHTSAFPKTTSGDHTTTATTLMNDADHAVPSRGKNWVANQRKKRNAKARKERELTEKATECGTAPNVDSAATTGQEALLTPSLTPPQSPHGHARDTGPTHEMRPFVTPNLTPDTLRHASPRDLDPVKPSK